MFGGDVPEHVTIIRFDPPAAGSAGTPAYRLVKEDDKAATTALLDEMAKNPDRVYIVDLCGKSFCGTMRLGLLIRMQQVMRSTGRVLRISADHQELLDLFRLTRLNTIMTVSHGLNEAIADSIRPI